MSANNIPLSLYIHIPWCRSKCPYCDFSSYAAKDIPVEKYLEFIIKDYESDIALTAGRDISTIFIGGGTPSILPTWFYQELLAKINPAKNIEITIEANPGTITRKQLQGLLNIGVNRLSIGIQSFDDAKLEALGRIHNHKTAIAAVKMAQEVGFNNINVDLMFGLPAQTTEQAIADLQQVEKLKVQHLSWYQLTIEPNTRFAHMDLALPNDITIEEMQKQGRACINSMGFQQYEISAYAELNFKCQHNLNYWQFGDYLGIGAGAHSKITNTETMEISRLQKEDLPEVYMDSDFIKAVTVLSKEEKILEFMINVFRLYQDIPLSLFEQRTGLKKQAIIPQLEQAEIDGFLCLQDELIVLKDKGKRFLNELLLFFA